MSWDAVNAEALWMVDNEVVNTLHDGIPIFGFSLFGHHSPPLSIAQHAHLVSTISTAGCGRLCDHTNAGIRGIRWPRSRRRRIWEAQQRFEQPQPAFSSAVAVLAMLASFSLGKHGKAFYAPDGHQQNSEHLCSRLAVLSL